MESFSLKSFFIFDPTLKPNCKKPSDNDIQDIKLLYYYPNNEDIIIKRSNSGIIEGTISFIDAFAETEDKFILVELTKFFYIANRFENNKYIAMILNKNSSPPEIWGNQNTETRKKWLNSFLKNFYNMFVLFHGPIHDVFFKNRDIREDENKYKNLCEIINDFTEGYFEHIQYNKIPLLDYLLYFPLNEISHTNILFASQRLKEKIPELKHSCLIYKGHILHNECSLEDITLLYNSFFSNLDSNPKFFNFSRPPYKVLQTVYTGFCEQSEDMPQTTSNFRKSFELIGQSNFIVGLSKININNYHVFIPNIYIKSTKEYFKLIVFYYNGLILFLFLNETFNPTGRINLLLKLDRWIKRYFDNEIPNLENSYVHKMNKSDNVMFAYLNDCNKAIKLSSIFYNKKYKTVEKEKLDLLMQVFKINEFVFLSSLMRIRGYYVYYVVSCQRKVVIILPDNMNMGAVKNSIEEIKKDLFEYIFLL
jgi:hypothetical protein